LIQTKRKTEICDFCHEETPIGCISIGPKTEVGMLDLVGVCPRCRLKGIYPSIEKKQKEIEEYSKRGLYMLNEDEWEDYHSTKKLLEDNIIDLKFLVNRTINYYKELHPLLFHSFNESYSDSTGAVERSGIYTYLDDKNKVSVHYVVRSVTEYNESHLMAISFTTDLGLSSFTVYQMRLEEYSTDYELVPVTIN